MSTHSLRRYRAERLLRSEFEGLRSRVISIVSGKLRAGSISLDHGDLEACYAQAWHGLYAAIIEGQEVANPTGWLVLVTYRRAIDESRSGGRDRDGLGGDADAGGEPHQEHDFAGELDDRDRLRHLFEGLRGRLSERECQAASLCYLQGLSRAQAADRIGISQARMRKLMEGAGPGRPGVAGKVGELLETISAGSWCEQQDSLMRALAFGILDPEGERHRLALAHSSECPACRRYVVSLRGLAATLPPLTLPWPSTAEPGPSATRGRWRHGRPRTGAAARLTGGHGGLLGAGGSLSGKLAIAGLIALGAGGGSLALIVDRGRSESTAAGQALERPLSSRSSAGAAARQAPRAGATRAKRSHSPARPQHARRSRSATDAAVHEFGPERSSSKSRAVPVRASASPAIGLPAPGRGPAGAEAQREFGIE